VNNKYFSVLLTVVIIFGLLFITGYIDKAYTYASGNKVVLSNKTFDLNDGCYQSMVFQRWYNALVYDEHYLESIRVETDKCESESCYFDIRLAKNHEIEALKDKDLGSSVDGLTWDSVFLLKEEGENNMYYALNAQALMFSSNSYLLGCIIKVN